MAIAKIGDLHIGSRNGSRYVRDFIKNYLINYFIPELVASDIHEVWQFGDTFDVRKFMYGRDKDWLKDELTPALKEAGIKWNGIVGNHDITLEESNRINWPSYLNELDPDVYCYYSEPTEVMIEGVKTLLLPWINKENYDASIAAIHATDAKYCFAHLELAGFKMYQSSTCDHGQIDVALLSKFDRVDTGHFHTRSMEGNIQYIGTPYHLNWEDYKDGTNRGFYVDDMRGGEVFIPNSEHQTLFRYVEYDYTKLSSDDEGNWIDPEWLNTGLGIEGQIVKVIVQNRDNAKHYEKFCDAMKRCKCIDYNFIDRTITVAAEKVEVTEEMVATDAVEVLKKDIRAGNNIQRPENVCKLAEHFYNAAQQRLNKLDA